MRLRAQVACAVVTAGTTTGDMPEFLTDGWFGWLDSVLSDCRVDGAIGLTLEYRVHDDEGSICCWHVRIASGRVSAATGPAGEASDQAVTLTSDRETARAIAIAGGSAQRAFAEGRLRLSGDPRLLLAARPALDAIASTLAGAPRATT